MNIAGFEIKKKTFIIALGVIALFVLFGVAKSNSRKKQEQREAEEKQRQLEEEIERERALAAVSQGNTEEFVYDFEAEMQKELEEEYGKPPEGFKWSMTGELVSLSDDESLPEDVLYYFLRALSVLDMSTAERYSRNSQVVNDYSNNYSELTADLNDYYRNFIRKQYKASLLSLEVLGTGSKSTMAKGDMYISVTIRSLDLTDKDFWQADREELFTTMRFYQQTETDNTKMLNYLYDYIASKYEDGTVGKKETTIELVLSKNDNQKSNGWLVTNDGELKAVLSYENGVNVAEYIQNEYETWLMQVELQETQDEVKRQQEELQEQMQQ